MTNRTSPIELGLTALALLLGALAFGWVFGWSAAGALVWVAIAASVVVPVAIGAALAPRPGGAPRPLLLDLVVQAVAWALVGTGLVVAAGGSVSDFASGLVHAWGSLISFTLPAGDEPTLLVVPITLCWFASFVATELVIRTRSPLAPAIVAGALLVAARLFGPGGPTDPDLGHVLLAAAIVVVGIVLAARRAAVTDAGRSRAPAGRRAVDDDDDRAAARQAMAGWVRAAAPVALAAAVVAGALALVVPFDRSAATLRSLHDPPPPDDVAVGNPLDRLTSDLGAAADEPVLDLGLTVGAVPEGTSMVGGSAPPLRLVTLDTFDGVEWSSSARYLRAGTELPPEEGSAATTVEVRQDITLTTADGPWLPAVAWPRSVALDGADPDATVAFDADDGGLVLEGGTTAGLRYSVVSAVPAVTAADEAAVLPSSTAFGPAIALPPGMPVALGGVANQAMGRAATPFQQLVSLESWLRANGRLDLDAPGGSSYGALSRFLAPVPPGAAGGTTSGTTPVAPSPQALADQRVGTPQQFAEAFTVLARSRGLPTRLVIGYQTSGAAGGSATVRRGDTVVWPESYLAGIGWVPFDPVPAAGAAPSTPTPPQIDEVTQAKTDAAARADDPDQSIPPAANPIVAAEEAEGSRPWLPVVVALVALAVVVALVVLVGRPLRARSRRRGLERSRRSAGTERLRVLGAWHHSVDALEANGAPSLRSATAADVADVCARRWGPAVADPVAALGTLVNDTVFEPDDGGTGRPGRADEAWRLADAVAVAAAATVPRADDPTPPSPSAPTAPLEAPASGAVPVG